MTNTAAFSNPSPETAPRIGLPAVPAGSPSSEQRSLRPFWITNAKELCEASLAEAALISDSASAVELTLPKALATNLDLLTSCVWECGPRVRVEEVEEEEVEKEDEEKVVESAGDFA